jgi:hypothetical protein
MVSIYMEPKVEYGTKIGDVYCGTAYTDAWSIIRYFGDCLFEK